MKESTRTIGLAMPKFKYTEDKDMPDVIIREIETAKIAVPNNVVDIDYFRMAVQYHIYSLGEKILNGKYIAEKLKQSKQTTKATPSQLEKLEKLNGEKVAFVNDFKVFMSKLDNIYVEPTEAIATFMSDGFSELFALWILGEKSYTVESSDIFGRGSTDTVYFHFPDESKVSGFVADFAEDITPQQKKQTVEAVNMYCNTHFKTWGGELYKNITYSISQKLLHDELFSRSRKQLKTDRKGRGITNVTLTNFELAFQLFSVCMYTQGIPFYNGKSITYIQEIGVKESTVARPTTKAEQQKPTTEGKKPATNKAGNKAK